MRVGVPFVFRVGGRRDIVAVEVGDAGGFEVADHNTVDRFKEAPVGSAGFGGERPKVLGG